MGYLEVTVDNIKKHILEQNKTTLIKNQRK